jgi:hypothetical protein
VASSLIYSMLVCGLLHSIVSIDIIQLRVVGQLMNDELVRIWKELPNKFKGTLIIADVPAWIRTEHPPNMLDTS